MPVGKQVEKQEKGKADKPAKLPQPSSFPLQVFKAHRMLIKLGPRLSARLIKLAAFVCLYKIFTNGGAESLAYVSYEHMLNEGRALYLKRKNGTQNRMPKSN